MSPNSRNGRSQRPTKRPHTIPPRPSPPMNATRTVITDQVVAPSNQPSIRDHTTSSINPEAPDAANRMMIPRYSGGRRLATT